MTKEQEEAIKLVKIFTKNNYSNPTGWTGYYDTELKELQQAMQTVLNMLKEKDKELDIKEEQIEYIKNEYGKTIEEQGKQIDLMAEFIFQNIDVEEDICNSAYVECTQETAQDITCINCIKQYFERKSEE